jgi:hypothetical protein
MNKRITLTWKDLSIKGTEYYIDKYTVQEMYDEITKDTAGFILGKKR